MAAGNLAFRFDDIRDDPAEAFFVELQRLGHIVEDAQIIHDQAVRFHARRRCGWCA